MQYPFLRRLRLRGKLLVLLLVVVIVAIGITDILWVVSMRNILSERISSTQQRLVQSASFRVNDFMRVKVRNLILHSQTAALLQKNLKTGEFELAIMLKQDRDITEVAFIDSNGQELIKLNRDKVFVQNELSDQSKSDKFIIPTSRFGIEYIGPVYFVAGEPMITVSVPVVVPLAEREVENISTIETDLPSNRRFGERLEGEILGVLTAEMNLSDLLRSVAAIDVGNQGYIYVLDESGKLIAHPNHALVERQENTSTADIIKRHKAEDDKLIAERGGHPSETIVTGQGLSELGVEVLATHHHIENLRWGVVLEQPVSEVFAPLTRILQFAVALFIGVLVFTVFVSIWFARLLTSALAILHKGVDVIGTGDLSYRFNIHTNDEIEDLADGFNTMALSLQEAFKKLEVDKGVISTERNKLTVTLSGITDAVIAVDLERKIIVFNNAAQKLTGYMESEVLGKNIEQIIRVFNMDLEVMASEYSPIHTDATEGVVFTGTILKVIGRKTSFVNLITGKIDKGVQNNLGCILTMHDVTKEQELEEMKLDFVSMAAHELRTPITSIKGYLYIFLRDYIKSMDVNQSTILSRINIAAQRLGSLVENLLNVSRIEKRELTLSLLPLDWIKYIDDEIAGIINQAKDKKIIVELIRPKESSIYVLADKNRINEVLSNLLANAVTYTPQGGRITVWIERKGNEVITHIQDNGVGIPKDALPSLFTKFFRVSGSLEQGAKGTGLGLYISKSIVSLHKGRIWVNSEIGKGTIFSFTLPSA